MPKMKTKSGAKKRFRVTSTGKVKAKRAYMRHMQMNKPKSMKRKARGSCILTDMDAKVIRDNYLPYARKTKNRSSSSKRPSEKAGA